MKTSDLIKTFRSETGDKEKPHFWDDDEVLEYANDAEREACRRARLLVDSSTSEVTKITIKPGTASYTLDDRIVFIRRVKLASRPQPLDKISYKKLDQQAPGWEGHEGDIRGYITDFETGKIRFYEAPTAADVARLTVIRLPLEDMTKDSDGPEIPGRLHRSLLYWMKHRAYMKEDAETKNEQKAADNLGLFEREFGKASTAIDEQWIQNEHGYDDNEGLF